MTAKTGEESAAGGFRQACESSSRRGKGSLTGVPAAVVDQTGTQRGGWSRGGSPSQ